jgi:DNA-binding helix-hairpin-helix protein with protein kinase domain
MTLHDSASLTDSNGNRVILGKKIGSGGEGDVYEFPVSNNKLVAKIYRKPVDQEKQEKLHQMVHGGNDDLKKISAWPVELLLSAKSGKAIGFLMMNVSEYKPIHMLYGPSQRKHVFPKATWQFLVRAAKNCAAAFSIIHKYGYVIGDVNEGNILVNDEACIRLIDCDSFQILGKDKKKYFCEVGVAQFTPPELQNIKNFKTERIPNHDNFGLSILLFQLLFMGRHPYSGVYHGNGDMPLEKAIAEYRYAFGKNANLKNISPPPNTVEVAIVPKEIRTAFEEAFTESGIKRPFRPSAQKWWQLLNDLESKLRYCSLERIHVYYSGTNGCPWCSLEAKTGILLFFESEPVTKFNLDSIWQRISSIKPPGPLPVIDPKNYSFSPQPLPSGLGKSTFLTKIFGMICGKEREEKIRRQKIFETCRKTWISFNQRWKNEANDEEYKITLRQVTKLKQEYEAIENEYKQALFSLQTTARERQLKNYLSTCFIENFSIPQIGINRKATLRSFGIETAADVSYYKIHGIPGFGDALTQQLLSWRQQMEKKFTFDPAKGVNKMDVQLLTQKFKPRMRPLERGLIIGFEKLTQIQQNILKRRGDLYTIVENSAKELAQAHANLIHFRFIR